MKYWTFFRIAMVVELFLLLAAIGALFFSTFIAGIIMIGVIVIFIISAIIDVIFDV